MLLCLWLLMRELIPFRQLVKVGHAIGLGKEQLATMKSTVWEDNVGALTLAHLEAPRMTPRSKHYAVKYHWFRQYITPNGDVTVEKVDTKEQLADIFTKGLKIKEFTIIRKLLMGW